MSTPPRRSALLAAAAVALPLLVAAGAFAQSRAPAPAPRVSVPKVNLPKDIAAPPAADPAAAVEAAAAAAVAPATVTAQAPQMAEGVAAIVNDDIISTYDLRQRMKLLIMTTGIQVTEETVPQLQQEALRSLVDEHLQMQEIKRVAKKQKGNDFIADDKEVDDEISDIAKQNNLNYAQMKTSFAASGVDIQTLREQIRTQITWQRLVSGMYGRNVRVGDDQVNNAMQRLSNQASQTQYQLAEIFIDSTRAGGMQQAIAGATQLIQQMQQGAPFAAVARQFSSAPTAVNGGEVGWVTAGQVQPAVAVALEEMRPGQLSAPIATQEGVYVVQLRDKRSGAGSTMVELKQAAIRLTADSTPDQVSAAKASLEGLKGKVADCKALDTEAAKVTGVVAGDLGEADVNDLSPEFRDVVGGLKVGQIGGPVRTPAGMHLVALCGKRATSPNAPSRDDIENRLYGESLALIARRELRDLRNSASIENR